MELTAAQLEELADTLVESDDQLLEHLVKLRKDHGLTQSDVAERMGVSQPTVAAFERYDANPTLSTLRRYALAVGGSVRHVVDDYCCAFTNEVFATITVPSSSGWQRPLPFEWSWSDGPAQVEAHVIR